MSCVSQKLFSWIISNAPQWVSRAGDVAKLPVDVSLNAGDVEEHVHPAGELSLKYFVLLCFHLAR